MVVTGENDEEGMKEMKEEAKAHNDLRHPEVKPMTDEVLETYIKSKWTREEAGFEAD